MNKKIVSAITLGLVTSQVMPYVAYATPNENIEVNKQNTVNVKTNIDWAKEYPKLMNPDKKDLVPVVFSPEVVLKLDDMIKRLDNLDKNFNVDELQKVLDDMFQLNIDISEDDVFLHKQYDQIDYIMTKVTYLAFTNLKEGTERNTFFAKNADAMYLSAVKRHNMLIQSTLMEDYGGYWGFTLNDYFKDEETKQILLNLASMLIGLGNRPVGPGETSSPDDFDPTVPETDLPSTIKPEKPLEPEGQPEEFPSLEPEIPEPSFPNDDSIIFPDKEDGNGSGGTGGNGGSNGGTNDDSNGGNNATLSTEEYNKRGNSCYKTTTIYDFEGKVLSTSESLVDKGLCNIFDYEVVDGNVWNSDNNVSNGNGDVALEVWESLGLNQLNKLSNNSIHYTINKDNEKPYYYDSGIRVSTNNTATYTQVKDVLIQISLKLENSYVIEDEGKLLFIADGKPLVVQEKQSEYTKSQIESLLNSFTSVGLKVDTIGQLANENFETQINNGNLSEIIVGDKTITLVDKPILEGSVLQLPIKEIAEYLDVKVRLEDKTLTLIKDDTTIEYEIGTKNVVINNNKKVLSTATQDRDGVVYGEMTLVAKELGYELIFNSSSSKIEFKK